MRVIDLVAACTTETCHTSIRLPMRKEQQYDNTQFSKKLRTGLVEHKVQISSASQNTPLGKQKKTLFSENSIHFLHCFCVSNKKKSDGKKLTPTQNLPNIGCGTLPSKILTLIKTDNA